MPLAWFLSRLCEEFHCLPSEALREWERAPSGLLEEILELRAFAHAKQICDHAKEAKDIPQTPMTDLVQTIEFGLMRERRRKRDADDAGD